MCGKDAELVKIKIEGSMMNVCVSCARHGMKISPPNKKKISSPNNHNHITNPLRRAPVKSAEKKLEIDEAYASLIKNARERKGMKQEEFAKSIAEKESVIHNLEAGKFEPSISLARKLEKALSIKLVEETEEKKHQTHSSGNIEMTLGDLITIRKRKGSK